VSIDNKNLCTIVNISVNFIKWGKDFRTYMAIIPRHETQLISSELFRNSTRCTRSKWLLRGKNFHHIWVKGRTQDSSQKTSTVTICIKLWMRNKTTCRFSSYLKETWKMYTHSLPYTISSHALSYAAIVRSKETEITFPKCVLKNTVG
jgi:hypothetical protein